MKLISGSVVSQSIRLCFVVTVATCLLSGTSTAAAEPLDLLKAVEPDRHAVAGSWSKSDEGLQVKADSGARLALPVAPEGEYDFVVSFTRRSGRDSIALIFTQGGGQATFEVDAWGQHLAGIQNIAGRDLRANATRVADQALENGRRYTAEVRVRKDRVEGWLNGQRLVTAAGDGSQLSMVGVWAIPDKKSLGIGAWNAETVFHSIEVRPVSGNVQLAAATPRSTTPQNTPSRTTGSRRPDSITPRPATTTSSPTTSSPTTPPASRPRPTTGGTTGRVLIVIANQDFFYREYADPRQELERAGFTVEVAAGNRSTCRPHANSGQGGDGGLVQPDLALSDVDPGRYDAILFSGGWGSSMYQYAFQGSYANRTYNGERAIKDTANRLITQFAEQDKFVCALCHGVSVLAWSRVNGRSLLAGRRATGATLPGPNGNYPGYQGTPVSRWNAEANGARMVPANSVGNPQTAADDIVVDGRIITGQDDVSAREMGRVLAAQLKAAGAR